MEHNAKRMKSALKVFQLLPSENLFPDFWRTKQCLQLLMAFPTIISHFVGYENSNETLFHVFILNEPSQDSIQRRPNYIRNDQNVRAVE